MGGAERGVDGDLGVGGSDRGQSRSLGLKGGGQGGKGLNVDLNTCSSIRAKDLGVVMRHTYKHACTCTQAHMKSKNWLSLNNIKPTNVVLQINK